MFNKIICRILMFLIPKDIIHKKVKVILKDDKLKIIIYNKNNNSEKFKKSVEKLTDYIENNYK